MELTFLLIIFAAIGSCYVLDPSSSNSQDESLRLDLLDGLLPYLAEGNQNNLSDAHSKLKMKLKELASKIKTPIAIILAPNDAKYDEKNINLNNPESKLNEGLETKSDKNEDDHNSSMERSISGTPEREDKLDDDLETGGLLNTSNSTEDNKSGENKNDLENKSDKRGEETEDWIMFNQTLPYSRNAIFSQISNSVISAENAINNTQDPDHSYVAILSTNDTHTRPPNFNIANNPLEQIVYAFRPTTLEAPRAPLPWSTHHAKPTQAICNNKYSFSFIMN